MNVGKRRLTHTHVMKVLLLVLSVIFVSQSVELNESGDEQSAGAFVILGVALIAFYRLLDDPDNIKDKDILKEIRNLKGRIGDEAIDLLSDICIEWKKEKSRK